MRQVFHFITSTFMVLSVMLSAVACEKAAPEELVTYTGEHVKYKGMSIESRHSTGGTCTMTTTAGIFRLNLHEGTIEIRQRVGENRLLAKITIFEERLSISDIPSLEGFDCTWAGNYPDDTKIIISGDSVIRFINFKKIEVALYFAPVHQKFNVSITPFDNGGLLALDGKGGLAIIPPSYASNKVWPKTFNLNTWKLAADKPLPLLLIGALPPRPYDWGRSFWPVVHYSSHIQRYPTDEQIAAYSKFAKVLEMHSWVWQSHCEIANGENKPLWDDCSYLPQNGRWIPYDENEFKRVIKTAHGYGLRVVPYVSSYNNTDYDSYVVEIKRLKDTYDIDGVYLDGLFMERPELGYPAARALRELFGEEGWLTHHDTHNSGCWAPFINTYMDLIITGEHESVDRWKSTSYMISNAIASHWPEIPLDMKDGREYLKRLVDNSLLYNNRVLLMTGEHGQWRDWRLYFNAAEMKFMQEYYLGSLEKIKRIGYDQFILESKHNKLGLLL